MTTNNNYRTGRDFEHRTRAVLREAGYDVIRAAGSKTKADLVAIKPGQVLFVQCKRTALPSPAERSELLRLSRCLGLFGSAVIARKGPRGTPVAFEQLTGPGPKQRQPFALDYATTTPTLADAGDLTERTA